MIGIMVTKVKNECASAGTPILANQPGEYVGLFLAHGLAWHT
jgi:hypothetical protein